MKPCTRVPKQQAGLIRHECGQRKASAKAANQAESKFWTLATTSSYPHNTVCRKAWDIRIFLVQNSDDYYKSVLKFSSYKNIIKW
jgi:hypothetical protein